jgi:hypothetical protein
MRLEQFRSKSFRFRFPEEFRAFRIPLAISRSEALVKLEKKFCFALGLCIYRIIVALRAAINLNPLQRLNEAYPDHSFHLLVAWRLRGVGAEAV